MKPTEITMQIVKNIAMFETVRLQTTYTLDDNDDLTQAFATARKQLETAFAKAYEKPKKPEKRKDLNLTSPEFDRVCKALAEGRTDMKELKKFFIIENEIIDYFTKHALI